MKQAIHKYQTSDYMEWDVMLSLIRKLYRDGNYRMSLLIGCGCFFGLRISDILTLTWSMLLNDDKFTINEKKTNKKQERKVVHLQIGDKHLYYGSISRLFDDFTEDELGISYYKTKNNLAKLGTIKTDKCVIRQGFLITKEKKM